MNDTLIGEIASFTLVARGRLEQEADEQLQGLYGWLKDGSFVEAARCPAVQALEEARETRRRLEQFAADEDAANLAAPDARKKLLREIAFTWLNRLVAFRLLEERKLIKQTISKLVDSNAFKFWLVEDANATAYSEFQKGDMPKNAMHEGPSQTAYRQFLLAQCASLAAEVSILFDPNNLPSRLCPRPGVLKELVESIDAAGVADAWKPGNEETLGWIYQFFVEKRKKEVFDSFSKGKQVTPEDIGPATQIFTPRWIVRALVENSLGRYWLDMHPDSAFATSLEYLVPLPDVRPAVPLKPAREITFLDPACGTMHFGLVAFDLFADMYREEIANAGKAGWPEKLSVSTVEEIASSIVAHNLHGIDIDLRAVQIATLVLLLRAKSLHKDAVVTDRNLACANVEAITGGRLEALIKATDFGNRAEERILRALAARVVDSPNLGSLLRLERDLVTLVEAERKKMAGSSQTELLLAGLTDDFFTSTRDLNSFFDQLAESISQRLDTFARDAGSASSHTAAEAAKGLRFLRLIQQRYDVVGGNPPYMNVRNQSAVMRAYFKDKKNYPDSKTDLYAVFIERANELVAPHGRLAFITQQSFMFIPSYEKLRDKLRQSAVIECMVHVGPRAFAAVPGEKVNATFFVLRREADSQKREANSGVYFRLVLEPDAESKRIGFEEGLAALRSGNSHSKVLVLRQHNLDTIPGKPWVYWLPVRLRLLFELPKVGDQVDVKEGINTGSNGRFMRFWWEIASRKLGPKERWVRFAKADKSLPFSNPTTCVVRNSFSELRTLPGSAIRNPQFAFRPAITFLSNFSKSFSAWATPSDHLFCSTGGRSLFADTEDLPLYLGLLNSFVASRLLRLINPTITLKVGDVCALPVFRGEAEHLKELSRKVLIYAEEQSSFRERNYSFSQLPLSIGAAAESESAVSKLHVEIDAEVSRLYGLSDEDLTVIRQELEGAPATSDETETESDEADPDPSEEEEGGSSSWSEQTLAQAWISYALGTVLGRYAIGEPDGLGRGEFDAPKIAAIRALIDPDGVMVAEKDHPQDIVHRAVQCLEVMRGSEVAHALIRAAAGKTSGDPEELLRDWLARFAGQPTNSFWVYHLQIFRNRPIYWPLQSAKKHFTVWVFHERFGPTTLFTIQKLADDQRRLIERDLPALSVQAATNKAAGKKRDDLLEATEDIQEFSNRLKTIADGGYTFCIDDGVLLNAAPLHPLLPSWPETTKAWQELDAGKYEWAQQAMKHWPDRVKEACKTNKSVAVAHKSLTPALSAP